jgi:hypothetical protein
MKTQTPFTQTNYNLRLVRIITALLESDPERYGYATCFADLHDTMDANELLIECDEYFTDLPDEEATDFAHMNEATAYADLYVGWGNPVRVDPEHITDADVVAMQQAMQQAFSSSGSVINRLVAVAYAALSEVSLLVADEHNDDGFPTSMRAQAVSAALTQMEDLSDADWDDPEAASDYV